MKISIFGLGYVGTTTAACLADLGHTIVGVEPNETKVDILNEGRSPIVEDGLGELLEKYVASGSIRATSDWKDAVEATDMAFVCVGTPSLTNGSLDLRYVRRAAEHIGSAIKAKSGYFTVVIRSTVLPKSVEDLVIPALEEHSGKRAGVDFGVCMNPEFLREGTAVKDFYAPPVTVIGEFDRRSGDDLAEIYSALPGSIQRVSLPVAEMVKYSCNAFHALKIVFGNEIGNICRPLGIDSHQVMEIFCQDTKLNLGPTYLKPGFAFGGSCLPKDLRALNYEARALDVETPMLNTLIDSNKLQVLKIVNKLREYKGKRLGFLGLSFKGGTDDVRESPMVELIESMLGKGFPVKIYDRYVSLARLTGANKEYIEREIPHLSSIMCSSTDELLAESDVIILSHRNEDSEDVLSKVTDQHVVVDLVRASAEGAVPECGEYYGICW